MTRPGIPCGYSIELRFSAVVFGPDSPAVRVEWWSTAGGPARFTGKHVIVPATQAAALIDALRTAAKESMQGPLFAPAPDQRQ